MSTDCEKEEGPIVQAILTELGYVFTLEDACEFWRDLSDETCSANWLGVKDNSDTWRERCKGGISRYIKHKRADAYAVLKTFPTEPKQ